MLRRQRTRGFTIIQVAVALGVLTILMGVVVQGLFWVKREAEMTEMVSRAGQLGTALQLYYQENRAFPTAYPAKLEEDLSPYVDNPKLFLCKADPGAGAKPLNGSYVRPLRHGSNRYCLALNSRHVGERSVVLYTNAATEIVESLPVTHGGAPVEFGSRLSGGSISFSGGSAIELSGNTEVSLARSFVASDGTPFHVVKHCGGTGSMTAVGMDDHIIEIAAEPALAFLRGGVMDVGFLEEDGKATMQVATRSGEVVVDGKITYRGQTVEEVVDNEEPEPEWEDGDIVIDEDHNIVVNRDCDATIRILGKAITYGAGGPPVDVRIGARIASPGDSLTGSVNLNPGNNSNFEFTLTKPDGSTITRDHLHESGGSFEYRGPARRLVFKPKGNGNQNSLVLDGGNYTLRNSDCYTITAAEMTVRVYNDHGNGNGHWWLNVESATGVRINDSHEGEWVWLINEQPVTGGEEHTQTIRAGTRIAVRGSGRYGSWHRQYDSTNHHRQVLVLLNGDMPPEFDPFDGQPEITTFLEPVIDHTTGRVTIEDHQALFLFEIGTTNMNSAAADFQDLVVLVDFGNRPAGDSPGDEEPADEGGNEPPADDPPADDPPAPELTHEALLKLDDVITVSEDASLCLRVVDVTLKNDQNRDVSVAIRVKVNDEWHDVRRGRAVRSGNMWKKKVDAGDRIVVKAMTYNGNDSVSYVSGDASGHVLVALKDEVPSRFSPLVSPPLQGFMGKVMDTTSHAVRVHTNQAVLFFELANDDFDNPAATFQDLVCVLTLTPESCHGSNKNRNNFDGWKQASTSNPMGLDAAEYAADQGFEWEILREQAETPPPPPPPSDPPEEDESEDEPDDTDDDGTEYTISRNGTGSRSLGSGTVVARGRKVKVQSYR
jgi:type II secretory pathway pseudopilin PulG